MPLVPETKMAYVSKLICLLNLLTGKITWLVLTITSSTSILSSVYGAYYMTRIVYKYSHLPTLCIFPFSLTVSTHSFQCDIQREHSHSQFRLTESTHSSYFFYIWLPAVNRHENVYSIQPFSSLLYFFDETFSSLEHKSFVKPQKGTNSRNTYLTRIGHFC